MLWFALESGTDHVVLGCLQRHGIFQTAEEDTAVCRLPVVRIMDVVPTKSKPPRHVVKVESEIRCVERRKKQRKCRVAVSPGGHGPHQAQPYQNGIGTLQCMEVAEKKEEMAVSPHGIPMEAEGMMVQRSRVWTRDEKKDGAVRAANKKQGPSTISTSRQQRCARAPLRHHNP